MSLLLLLLIARFSLLPDASPESQASQRPPGAAGPDITMHSSLFSSSLRHRHAIAGTGCCVVAVECVAAADPATLGVSPRRC
ncbi:hypothetical protein KK141_15935 [Dyella sp. LX-66]|uniref:hypothetical protein n=1 Tax=unclassified Dyella TaxID=2634549 RepID=UPI001BE08EAE|nr:MULTISPECIES: hypothetical protein [unclassified Dyella]MBT2118689.1 hypothetical protein [Dyella sp. LX-1]MBT2141038.1 hypothetical protein [Dyella sp. LX-66]